MYISYSALSNCESEFDEIVQQTFQYGYETGSQEAANELGKQVQAELNKAFRRYK